MLVREIMTTTPVTVTQDATLRSALFLLARHHLTCLPVVDADDRIVGVVSEADLVREAVLRDPRLHLKRPVEEDREVPLWARSVSDVMSTDVVSMTPDSDVVDAVELFTSAFFKTLPVLDHRQRVVGMISRSDIVRLVAQADQDIHRQLVETMASMDLPDWPIEVRDGCVEITGPATDAERTIARVIARTVPGVVEIRVL